MGPSWAPSWPQVEAQEEAKIDEKSMPKSIEILMRFRLHLGSHFAPSWVPKWSQLGLRKAPQNHLRSEIGKYQKNSPRCRESSIFQVPGAHLGHQNRSQNGPKSDPGSEVVFLLIFIGFGAVLGANLGPKRPSKTRLKPTSKSIENRRPQKDRFRGLLGRLWLPK